MLIAIVPAYNEAKNIGSTLKSLFDHVDQVVVVDDGSVDKTAAIAKSAGATVLRHRINRGQGAALQTGHEYAINTSADFVLHFDGDGQLDVMDIKPALERIKETSSDVLLGSRFLDDRSNVPLSKRYLIHPIGRLFQRLFHGLKLTDTHNGFRILNQKALLKIKITQDGMAHASEIPVLAKKNNLKIVEFPVRVVYREYGQGVGGGFGILKDLFLGKFVR